MSTRCDRPLAMDSVVQWPSCLWPAQPVGSLYLGTSSHMGGGWRLATTMGHITDAKRAKTITRLQDSAERGPWGNTIKIKEFCWFPRADQQRLEKSGPRRLSVVR